MDIKLEQMKPIQLQIHYGNGDGYNKQSLKAYKYENELKKAVKEKYNSVKYKLFNKFQVPFISDVKVSEPGEAPVTERFTVLELINSKLTSINATTCLSVYDIYKEKGIEEAICNLHLQSSLTII